MSSSVGTRIALSWSSENNVGMGALNNGLFLAVMFVVCGIAAPVRAQTNVERPLADASAAPSSRTPALRNPLFAPTVDFDQIVQPPAGPPPTPRHTGIKALVKGLIIDFKYLPSRENLMRRCQEFFRCRKRRRPSTESCHSSQLILRTLKIQASGWFAIQNVDLPALDPPSPSPAQ